MKRHTIKTTLLYRLCLVCKTKLPEDYEYSYCCDGYMCGCYGLPPEPWTCSKTCEDILFGRYYQYRHMWE